MIVRADFGAARKALVGWWESSDVEHPSGLVRNGRLAQEIQPEMERARREAELACTPARRSRELAARTHTTWSRARRVVANAGWLGSRAKSRFIVTSLSPERRELSGH
jgi:hypothetical protein